MYPEGDTGDVFRHLENSNFNFTLKYAVDFFAIYAKEEADKIAKLYVADWIAGRQKFKNIETQPFSEGGMELILVPMMKVTYENIV